MHARAIAWWSRLACCIPRGPCGGRARAPILVRKICRSDLDRTMLRTPPMCHRTHPPSGAPKNHLDFENGEGWPPCAGSHTFLFAGHVEVEQKKYSCRRKRFSSGSPQAQVGTLWKKVWPVSVDHRVGLGAAEDVPRALGELLHVPIGRVGAQVGPT